MWRAGLFRALVALRLALPAGGATAAPAPGLDFPPEVARAFAFAAQLNLADERYRLEPSRGDGSTCYLKLGIPDPAAPEGHRIWGAIIPAHAGTNLHAEVFHFTLATLLGIGALEGPAALIELRGPARARFVRTIAAADYRGDAYRTRHQAEFLAHARGSKVLIAVAKPWGPAPHDAGFLVANEHFAEQHPLAAFLRADRPQPSDRMLAFPGITGQASERALARQLSNIFVVDALTNQRDRFSGGNLALITVPSGAEPRLQFVSYDNGDALDEEDPAFIRTYLRFLTRFDRAVADRLVALDRFLRAHTRDRAADFAGFRSEPELARALGLGEQPRAWALFRRNLGLLVAHIAAVTGDKYFRD